MKDPEFSEQRLRALLREHPRAGIVVDGAFEKGVMERIHRARRDQARKLVLALVLSWGILALAAVLIYWNFTTLLNVMSSFGNMLGALFLLAELWRALQVLLSMELFWRLVLAVGAALALSGSILLALFEVVLFQRLRKLKS